MPSFRDQLQPVSSAAPNKAPFEMTPEERAAYDAAKTQTTGLVQHKKSEAPLPIRQRTHEKLNKMDRYIISNFSNDPVTAADWLRKKYPDMDIGIVGGQIGMKPKGSPEDYFAVVPKFSISELVKNPSEILNQMSDVAYDIKSGILTGAAAAGAAGLAAPTSPLGMLAAGTAAAGTTGAALEATRQGIGQMYGVNKEIKPGEVIESGVVNAASVPLFGAGKAKGAVGKAYDFVAGRAAPALGEFASGVPAQTIRNQAEYAPIVSRMSKESPRFLAKETRNEVKTTLAKAKSKVGQEIGNTVSQARGEVDLTDVKQVWKDTINSMEREYAALPTPEMKARLDSIKDKYENYFSITIPDEFGNPIKTEVTRVTPQQAFTIKKQMGELGELGKVKQGQVQSTLEGKSVAQKELISLGRDSETLLDNGITSVAEQSVPGKSLVTLNKEYSDLVNLQKDLNSAFKTNKSTMRAMQSGDPELLATLQEMDKNLGSDLITKAKIFDAYRYFGNPSFLPVSTKGTVSTGRIGASGGIGAAVGSSISNKMGMGYMPGAVAGLTLGTTVGGPAAIKQYANVGRGVRKVQNFLGPFNAAPGQVGANIYNENDEQFQSPWTLFPQEQK